MCSYRGRRGFSTPAGKDLATNVWCVLDAAGLGGLDLRVRSGILQQ
ncbi:hypothetical protein [Microtetraspora sp. NBRC 16547]|nr:hypothetical protein [Microtetraspora sp. NBRC 16547]